MDPATGVEDALKFPASADTPVGRQGVGRQWELLAAGSRLLAADCELLTANS
jgi:hypothetical protein